MIAIVPVSVTSGAPLRSRVNQIESIWPGPESSAITQPAAVSRRHE
ncbi:hypothetical protein [Kribbella solani]|uniref:Uncharacterized protein n=1 Tax=Kribbella solani TaxID=236067 RepID=A0A841E3Q3_9ACTN|nr:hypothetical protein [Kribbella solani]MBB5983635.1 hypothetical protein [Kribbella solani]